MKLDKEIDTLKTKAFKIESRSCSEKEAHEKQVDDLKFKIEDILEETNMITKRYKMLQKTSNLVEKEKESLLEMNKDLNDEIVLKDQIIDALNEALVKQNQGSKLKDSSSSLAEELDSVKAKEQD